MSEIIYSEIDENKAFSITRKDRQVAKDRYSVWQSPDKVTVARGEWHTGIRHDQTNRWWKWHTQEVFGFFRTSTGLAQPFHCVRPEPKRPMGWKNLQPVRAIEALGGESGIETAFTRAMWESFSIKALEDVYPMADHFGIDKFGGMPIGIRHAFRAGSIEDMTTRLFGKTKLDKMAEPVANADPWLLSLSHQFRGHADDDVIVYSLGRSLSPEIEQRLSEPYSWGHASSPSLRRSLAFVDKKTCDALLDHEVSRNDYAMLGNLSVLNNRKKEFEIAKKHFDFNRNIVDWKDFYRAHNW